uniref:NADH-ubiquinone oxidoreductase chain 4L n=1 Tax=Paroedura picta TaxID=143630 RepID=A0A0U2I632_9SAUR|nr:NADH dehydrogenase subunit 4L [Paroedura picta]ALF04037.1 NADH dehydrogenase subunit 4L [Paroedura picta]
MSPTHLTTAILFFTSAAGLILYRKHLVSALLCLEGLMLATFLATVMSHQDTNLSTTSTCPITLLTLAACEASAGLSLLTATTRAHASDHIKNLSLLKC